MSLWSLFCLELVSVMILGVDVDLHFSFLGLVNFYQGVIVMLVMA